jgi:hypothetical protein
MAFSRRGNQTRIRPGFRTIVASDSRWATHRGTPAARTDGRVSVVCTRSGELARVACSTFADDTRLGTDCWHGSGLGSGRQIKNFGYA